MDEKRGGYDDYSKDRGSRKGAHEITQRLLHVLAAEIAMNMVLGREGVVVRTDFALSGPSLSHLTIFAVLSFFKISQKWINFFCRALETPLVFSKMALTPKSAFGSEVSFSQYSKRCELLLALLETS